MDPAPSALWSIVLGLAVGWSLPRGRSDNPAPAAPGHTLDCSCEAELRELLAAREQLEWWRLVALVLGLVAGLLALGLLLGALCLAGLCRCCCGGARPSSGVGAPATRVKVETKPRVGDTLLLQLLAAAEMRRWCRYRLSALRSLKSWWTKATTHGDLTCC